MSDAEDFSDDSDSVGSLDSSDALSVESDDDDGDGDGGNDSWDEASDDDASFISDDGSADTNDLMLPTDFTDEADALAFDGIPKKYFGVISRLKDGASRFFNYNFHSRLSHGGKERLGGFLAGASHVIQANVTLQEERPQSLDVVFRGPFRCHHDLRRFKLELGGGDDADNLTLSPNDWECISRYLSMAPSLCHLELNDLALGKGEAERLASALRGCRIKTLGFQGLDMRDGDDGPLGRLLSSTDGASMKTIDIVCCDAGRGICKSLASILRNKAAKLEIINLHGNVLDDECVQILCESLAENTSLQYLHLEKNEKNSSEGWKLLERLVWNTKSLEHIYRSNHSLLGIQGAPRSHVCRINQDKLCYRSRHSNMGHFKILHFLTEEWKNTSYAFKIEPFAGYNVEMMPHILEFFGNHIRDRIIDFEWKGVKSGLIFVYEIIRRWNVPELFGFPSAESVRLGSRIADLETANNNLQARNDELLRETELLRAEVARLQSESDLSRTGEGGQSRKRTRS